MIKRIIAISFVLATVWATPSTQIWNPATDIQALGTTHLGIDNYYNQGADFATDLGLTYGLIKGLEVGVDFFYPNVAGPFSFNAKYGVDESGQLPAMAVGINGFGLVANDANTDFRQIYGVLAKNIDQVGRLSAGYFMANSNVVGADNKGFILTWDKAMTDKVWVCIDYASGNSTLGTLFGGFSYAFAANTSIIFGIGKFNNGGASYFTTQLDINI